MSETNAVVEKSLRSVFVGNIPYEATEDKLKDIFSQVGPVLSFKLMYDRESGKPKGYGFCEYKDQETALSAMRNLNGYEIGGRALRVDNACTEKSRMEMQSLMMGPVIESPYGPEVDADKAPEAISNAVASLPPEQMYELMRQMKVCVRDNPTEARTMLMNNPQLAYALLQAQVVMRIIEPKVAVQILHGERESAEPVLPSGAPMPNMPHPSMQGPTNMMNGGLHMNQVRPQGPMQPQMPQGPMQPPMQQSPVPMPNRFPQPNVGPMPPQGGPGPGGFNPPPLPVPPPGRGPMMGGDFDHRHMNMGPRGPVSPPGPPGPSIPMPGPPMGDQDMRMTPMQGPGPLKPKVEGYPSQPPDDYDCRHSRDQRGDLDQRYRDVAPGGPGREMPPPNRNMPPSNRDIPVPVRDMRDTFMQDPRDRDNRGVRDPRDIRGDPRDPRGGDRDYGANGPLQMPPSGDARDPRGRHFPTPSADKDFRIAAGGLSQPSPGLPAPVPRQAAPPTPQPTLPPGLADQDQEKANLIMQVLQLSDEQIRMLPPEQQNSIIQLKEQIQRSQQQQQQ